MNEAHDNFSGSDAPVVVKKYLSYETSGIKIEVAGDNTVEIVLECAPPADSAGRRSAG